VAVAKGFELRIATALSDRGVRSSSSNSKSRGSSSGGGLRVQAGVDERHLLQDVPVHKLPSVLTPSPTIFLYNFLY
jgi:hypothetical protein